jgi:hypothetical protein
MPAVVIDAISVVFLLVVRGTFAVGTFAVGSAGVAWREIDSAAALVNHHELRSSPACYLFPIHLSGLIDAFGGSQRLFLYVPPKGRMARPMVH